MKATIPSIVLALLVSAPAYALPNTDPTDPGGPTKPVLVRVSGALTFRGCSPSLSDVTVRILNPSRTGQPTTPSASPDGSLRMSYSIVVGVLDDEFLPEQVTVKPSVKASVCGSGTFTPTSRTVTPGATNVNFDYQAPAAASHSIPVDTFLLFANGFLSDVGLHLHNDGHQDSFITIDGVTSSFDVSVTRKDLPGWGTGSGIFNVRNMNLDDTEMSFNGNSFNVRLGFEEAGIEIKGRHSYLGDLAMPDFQMSNIDLNVSAGLAVRNGQLTIGFSNARLDAGVASTGACNVFGLDWCNFLFGTSGDIRKKFQETALAQLQGSTIQNALRASLAEALADFGVTGTIGTVTIQGDQIVITTL